MDERILKYIGNELHELNRNVKKLIEGLNGIASAIATANPEDLPDPFSCHVCGSGLRYLGGGRIGCPNPECSTNSD